MATRRTNRIPATSRLVTPGRLGLLLLLLAALWVGSGFVQQMVLAYRLNAQVVQLQKSNRLVAEQNRAYQQQLQSLQEAGGKEELERQHNYARPDEKVYVITGVSPSPVSPARSAAASQPAQQQSSHGFWGDFWSALTSVFH